MQAKKCIIYNFNIHAIFLAKVVSHYIKMHYEKFQDMNFLVLIRSCILIAQTW